MVESLICDAIPSLDVFAGAATAADDDVAAAAADGSDVEFFILPAPSGSWVLSDICFQSVNSISGVAFLVNRPIERERTNETEITLKKITSKSVRKTWKI